ncbi:uncharacterized protein BCR38DRAFT_500670 [Pseudomassariella vexata]|uniref:Uncharacterized protein n=1 Tax=Pseudomassariella vexata TaxID=1141098 RepID=A0A1Y2DG39_9PEZI|nr:uncharacterized protein BCR38DRAFT_500670 [Pseudomassariella vexata]ORY58044.1 hypothetical protein BCR38DRAFT_500670 [Pseudomassariella vexata]
MTALLPKEIPAAKNPGLHQTENQDEKALDACYFTCNAAFLKAQVSREWEDYCESGSAFETYINNCLCCIGPLLHHGYKAIDYLAHDFGGQLKICDDRPPQGKKLQTNLPCGVLSRPPAIPITMPYPAKTVWIIDAPGDSLSVGVSYTYNFKQLREGHNDSPPSTKVPGLDNISTLTSSGIPTAVITIVPITFTDALAHTSISSRITTITPTTTTTATIVPVSSNKIAIAGIVLGAVFGILLFIATPLALFGHKSRKSRKQQSSSKTPNDGNNSEKNPPAKIELPAYPISPRELEDTEIPAPVELDVWPMAELPGDNSEGKAVSYHQETDNSEGKAAHSQGEVIRSWVPKGRVAELKNPNARRLRRVTTSLSDARKSEGTLDERYKVLEKLARLEELKRQREIRLANRGVVDVDNEDGLSDTDAAEGSKGKGLSAP